MSLSMHKHDFIGHILSQLKDSTHVERRYAESTIASDISKIMDSMVQKNFVNFLLNQREKKSEWVMAGKYSMILLINKKIPNNINRIEMTELGY